MKKRVMQVSVSKVGLLGLALASGLWAAPANPAPFTVDNGGDSLTIQRLGDEHYSFVQTVDGFLVVKDSLGVYYYADENGTASIFKAKDAAKRPDGDKQFLKTLDRKKSREGHRKRHPDLLKYPADAPRGPAPWANPKKLKSPSGAALMKLPAAPGFTSGTNRFPVVLVQLSGAAVIDSAATNELLNKEGYNANGYLGSVRDYFKDQSSGLFVPTFDLYVVSVNNTASAYQATSTSSTDERYKLGVDAIAALKSKYQNFDASHYDADNDGEVDAIVFIYAGDESSGLGGYNYSFQYTKAGRIDAGNGKKFNNYLLTNRQDYLFASFIHEFSHCMGLVDHYCVRADNCYDDFSSSNYQAPGAHAWDVMATGMYNGSGKVPPNYSAFERNSMGWLDYDTLNTQKYNFSIKPLDESNRAYKIPVPGKEDEWFILENRQIKNKWDSKLPNHGLLIWHIDYDYSAWFYDKANDDASHQRVDLVEAGNMKVPTYRDGYRTTNLMDDPFPGSQNVTSFSGFKSWDGVDLGVQLYSIVESGEFVCISTKQGVEALCNEPESSSSAAVSSSSYENEAESSSSSLAVDAVRPVYAANFSLIVKGSSIGIQFGSAGLRKVEVFDLQGHLVYGSFAYDKDFSIDLSQSITKGAAVIRVLEGNHVLGVKRVRLL